MIDVPVLVKDALRDGRMKKNYRFIVLNDDGTTDFTIDNDNLVSESVNIDERMCSGDTIKFGLCEGSSLEFQYFEKPNITGRRIQAFVDVFYGESLPEAIPMGFFDVAKCSRQASTDIIKVTAYNKLQSDYLDAKANLILLDTIASNDQVTVFDIRYYLLGDYKILENRAALGQHTYSSLGILDSFYPSFGSFKFNALYGKKSPINAYEFGISSTSTSFDLRSYSDVVEFDLDANSQVDALYGTLKGLEANLVSYLEKVINDAGLNRSWSDALDYICTHDGFQKIIGICDGDINDEEAKWYSTIQWEYEEAHGLTHTVAGKILDGQRLTTVSKGISVIVPSSIKGANYAKTIYYEGKAIYSGSQEVTEYEYYVDNTLTTRATESMPYVTFSEGTKYVYHTTSPNVWGIQAYRYDNISDADKIKLTPDSIPDFTLREIQSAVFETEAQFGQLSRITDLFSGVELNHSRLYPADTLYPATNLYPSGAAVSGFKSMYSKLWADEGNVHKFRNLIITYKGLDEEQNETDYTLQRTVNADGTDDYNMSDNWLFRNLVWTAADVGDYADAMVAKMQDVTWFPFEMWCAGLPYLETGDEIEIPLGENSYTSYILQRQLKGIQSLQDTYINGTLDIF